MKRRDKADRIGATLDELYPETPIPLDHKDPYTLMVAVLLSAQCTDERVNTITPTLFGRADNPYEMAATPVEEVLEIVRPCGLGPSKAKNIVALSKILVEEHGGVVPDDFKTLEALPGIGHKSASVVMTQAFGVPAFPVDTHIHRLAIRWGLTKRKSTVARTEKDLKASFAEETWGKRHLQIIFFGREYCPALGHDFDVCPICTWAASKAQVAAEAKLARDRLKMRRQKAAERQAAQGVS